MIEFNTRWQRPLPIAKFRKLAPRLYDAMEGELKVAAYNWADAIRERWPMRNSRGQFPMYETRSADESVFRGPTGTTANAFHAGHIERDIDSRAIQLEIDNYDELSERIWMHEYGGEIEGKSKDLLKFWIGKRLIRIERVFIKPKYIITGTRTAMTNRLYASMRRRIRAELQR